MNVKQLKDKIKNLPDELPVLVMNNCIENDECCPAFKIVDIEKFDENPASEAFLSIQIDDEKYINKNYNINA